MARLFRQVTEKGVPDLLQAPTVTLYDDDGSPDGYLSGESLHLAVERIHEVIVAPVNEQRIGLMDDLTSWSMDLGLTRALAHIFVDPTIEVLTDPHRARTWLFCMAAVFGNEFKPRLGGRMWSRFMMDRLIESNPHIEGQYIRATIATTQRTMVFHCLRQVEKALPLDIGAATRHRANLLRVVAGMLSALTDDGDWIG